MAIKKVLQDKRFKVRFKFFFGLTLSFICSPCHSFYKQCNKEDICCIDNCERDMTGVIFHKNNEISKGCCTKEKQRNPANDTALL